MNKVGNVKPSTGFEFNKNSFLNLEMQLQNTWMNDSGFWIICRLSNLTEKEGLKTITPLLAIMGLTGLIVIMIGAKIFPLV